MLLFKIADENINNIGAIMKKFLILFIIAIISISETVYSQPDTVRACFVGNSYTATNDLPALIANIAGSLGDMLIYQTNAPGGATLEMHSTDNTTLDMFNADNWDYVVLQEQSQKPAFPLSQVEQEVFPFVKTLDESIKQSNPDAKTTFFMTWGWKNGDPANCPNWPPVCTYEGMDSLLNLRYRMMADTVGGIISPVGAVWRYIREKYPVIELYQADDSHPSEIGSYAAAVAFYTVFFKNDPMLIDWNFTLSDNDAAIIKEAVQAVVYDHFEEWNMEAPNIHNFTYNDQRYEVVKLKKTWEEAAAYAVDRGGRLVHISSVEENDAIYDAIINGAGVPDDYIAVLDGGGAAYLWIGATDKNEEGKWLWDGDNDGNGVNFWNGQGKFGMGNGEARFGMYCNWGGMEKKGSYYEPDNYLEKQHAAAMGISIWPQGNKTGYPKEWNDLDMSDEIYFVIEYDFIDEPGVPEILSGDDLICDPSNEQLYIYTATKLDIDAGYHWSVDPEEAAVSTDSDTSGSVVWSPSYRGEADLYVTAYNESGETMSEAYHVRISSNPMQPGDISGPEKVCIGDGSSEYIIQPVEAANSYIWIISPFDAGYVAGHGDTVMVTWSSTFTGTANLKVKSSNDCGESEYSQAFDIFISEKPDQLEKPAGPDSLKINAADTEYTTVEVENVEEYIWGITPADAGEITPDGAKASINWRDDFEGDAEISVRATNYCGSSEWSEKLIVKITDPNSVRDIQETDNIKIFPNPTDGSFKIETIDEGIIGSDVEIRDINGRLILKTKIDNYISEFTINTPGVYIIDIISSGKIIRKMQIVY